MVKSIGWIAVMSATLAAFFFLAAGLTAQSAASPQAAKQMVPDNPSAFSRSGVQGLSHESRAGQTDGISGRQQMYAVPCDGGQRQAFDSETR